MSPKPVAFRSGFSQLKDVTPLRLELRAHGICRLSTKFPVFQRNARDFRTPGTDFRFEERNLMLEFGIPGPGFRDS